MKAFSTCLVIALLVGCGEIQRSVEPPRYNHVVIMWLKEPGNAEHRQKIIDTTHSFVGKIPGLLSATAGPVHPSTRPVVDSSYDVGVIMVFDSEESLAKYPSYSVHQRAVEEVIKPLVDHFKVYDFAEENSPRSTRRTQERN